VTRPEEIAASRIMPIPSLGGLRPDLLNEDRPSGMLRFPTANSFRSIPGPVGVAVGHQGVKITERNYLPCVAVKPGFGVGVTPASPLERIYPYVAKNGNKNGGQACKPDSRGRTANNQVV
jgi:hypothetical protein